jgi:hypothetical protein
MRLALASLDGQKPQRLAQALGEVIAIDLLVPSLHLRLRQPTTERIPQLRRTVLHADDVQVRSLREVVADIGFVVAARCVAIARSAWSARGFGGVSCAPSTDSRTLEPCSAQGSRDRREEMPMQLKLRSSWMVALPLLAVAAGCGPSWVVVKQATPNPMLGQKGFSIEPVIFDGMKIGNPGKITEEEWIASKKPDEKDKFVADLTNSKERLNARFAELCAKVAGNSGLQVAAGRQEGTFVVRPQVLELEGGFNAFMVTAPAVVRLQVHILDPQGQEVDVFEIAARADAGSFGAMVTRLGMVGERLGTQAGRYLAARAAGK